MVRTLRHAALVLAFALLVSISSAGARAEFVIEHAQGRTVLPKKPEKVLVLDINTLDIAEALGAQPAGVLGSNLPPWLKKYADPRYARMGTLFEPDLEAINAAGADLAIVGVRSRGKLKDVAALVPAVDLSFDQDKIVESVKANITKVGTIFGKEAEAARLVADLDARVAKLRDSASGAGTALILVVNGGKVGAYGPTSRIGWLHRELGFKTVESKIDDRFHGGDVVSFEYILEKNPDWIFVIDRDAAVGAAKTGGAAAAVLDNELVRQTSAAKLGRIVYLDPAAAYIAPGGYTALTILTGQIQATLDRK
nr:ABC transporter substrate-binding protein [Rhodomicrobium udaipurense]